MYPNTYTIERNGIFKTIRSCNDAVGVARGMFPDLGKVSWVAEGESTVVTNGKAIVNVTKHKL